MKQVRAESHAIPGTKEILEVVGPAIDEVFAVDEPIDQLVALVRIFVAAGRRSARRQAEFGRSHRAMLGARTLHPRRAGVRDAVLFHATEDVFVDEILARDGPGQIFRRTQWRSLPGERFSVLRRLCLRLESDSCAFSMCCSASGERLARTEPAAGKRLDNAGTEHGGLRTYLL